MNSRVKKSFEAFGLRWSRRRDRGATALVVALCLTLLMFAAAVSFDTANLAMKRQTLQNVTDAAAQAGASYLPNVAAAKAAANEYFHRYDRDLGDTSYNPDLNAYCIVQSAGVKPVTGALVAAGCDPNPGTTVNYTNGDGVTHCDDQLCAIDCTLANAKCNALQVTANKDVPYYFAPAIGIQNGSTGAVTSVSCRNGCGSGGTPNPLDVAIIADRTPSMSNTDFDAMKKGIETSLPLMTPEYQFVTMGTIHRSNVTDPNAACQTKLGAAVTTDRNGYYPDKGARAGEWMPLDFYNNYLSGTLGDPVGTRTLNTTTKSITNLGYQVECMDHVDTSHMTGYPWNTHLGAPLKEAANLLLGVKTSNLKTLSDARALRPELKNVAVKKWIIFETDGQPTDTMGSTSKPYRDTTTPLTPTQKADSVKVGNFIEPTAPGQAQQGCQDLISVATSAKNAGIGIIMIAYGDATSATCGSLNVRDVMASSASNAPDGQASKASTCSSPGAITTENGDNDYFFCASTAADLQKVFETAIGMTSSSKTKFVKMPK